MSAMKYFRVLKGKKFDELFEQFEQLPILITNLRVLGIK